MRYKGTLQSPWEAQTVFGFGVATEPEHCTPSGHCLVSNRRKRKVEAKKDTGVDDASNTEIFKVHLTLTCGLYLLWQIQLLGKPGKWSIHNSLFCRMGVGKTLSMYRCYIFKREWNTYTREWNFIPLFLNSEVSFHSVLFHWFSCLWNKTVKHSVEDRKCPSMCYTWTEHKFKLVTY